MDDRPTYTLRQLELFCAAADRGSFAAAAEALFVTPNTVGSAVGELESLLGVELCVRRRSRGLTLTPAGQQLRAQARRLLRDALELQLSVSGHGDALTGPVVVGCYSTLAATVLPPLLAGFAERYPNVELDIVDGTMQELLPRLRDGELDLVLTYRINVPDDLEQRLLYETEVHVLLSERHRLAAAPSVSLDDLRDEPLILLDLPPSGEHSLEMMARVGVHPVIRHRTPNFELVRSLVGRGFGYSLLIQKPSIDESYEGKKVVAKRIFPQLSAEAAIVVWPKRMRLSERAQALVSFARETVSAHQWTPIVPQDFHPDGVLFAPEDQAARD